MLQYFYNFYKLFFSTMFFLNIYFPFISSVDFWLRPCQVFLFFDPLAYPNRVFHIAKAIEWKIKCHHILMKQEFLFLSFPITAIFDLEM